jgi:hypothetical protein
MGYNTILTLLIIHGISAFLLLGATTHQVISVWIPNRVHVDSFFDRTRAVSGRAYSVAIIVLFITTFVLGMVVYPDFKLTANNVLVSQKWEKASQSFEFKEHVLAIGLGLLPAYWHYWKPPLARDNDLIRAMLATSIAVITWVGFIVGHILNNIAGLGVR